MKNIRMTCKISVFILIMVILSLIESSFAEQISLTTIMPRNEIYKLKAQMDSRYVADGLKDDADLQFYMGANETWEIEISCTFATNASQTLEVGVNGPAGSTPYIDFESFQYGNSKADNYDLETNPLAWPSIMAYWSVFQIPVKLEIGGGNAEIIKVKACGIVTNGSTAGTFTFRWASLVSQIIVMYQYSYLKATKIVNN